MRFGLAILFVAATALADIDIDTLPAEDLAETTQSRWWCPAENYGKANIEWPLKHRKEWDRIRGDRDTYIPVEQLSVTELQRKLARSVGRLDTYWYDPAQRVHKMATCTASIVSHDHILTNRHCVVDDTARLVKAQLRMGYLSETRGGKVYEVDVSIIDQRSTLDYAVLSIRGSPGVEWGVLPFKPRDPDKSEELFIIHHPAGIPQRVTANCHRSDLDIEAADYGYNHDCRMEPGSSGSPVFSAKDGTIVGLNYAYIPPERRSKHSDLAPFYMFSKRVKYISEISAELKRYVWDLGHHDNRLYWVIAGRRNGDVGTTGRNQWVSRNSIEEITAEIRKSYAEEGRSWRVWHVNHYRRNGKHTWAMTMGEFNFGQQFQTFGSWAEAVRYVKAQEQQGYVLSTLTHGEGTYFVAMDSNGNGTRHAFGSWHKEFPAEEIQQYREKGWTLFELVYDEDDEENRWVAAYLSGPNFTTGPSFTWISSANWPAEDLADKEKAGWNEIFQAYYFGNSWYVILRKGSHSLWRSRVYLPEHAISDMWDRGYFIELLVPGYW